MFIKLALSSRLSRPTVGQLHQYLSDFGQGQHRVIWNRNRAFIEVENPSDVALLREQFPQMVRSESTSAPTVFPW